MLKCFFIMKSDNLFSMNHLVNGIRNIVSIQNRYMYEFANLIMIKASWNTALLNSRIMFLLIKLHILTIVYKVSIVRFTKVFVWSKKAAVSRCTNIAEFDPSIKWVNCAWNMKNHYSYIFCLIKYAIDYLSSQGYSYCYFNHSLSQNME